MQCPTELPTSYSKNILLYVRSRTEQLGWRDDDCPDDGWQIAAVRCVRKLNEETRSSEMSVGTMLLIALVLALLSVIPTWRHSRGWGYAPSGLVGLLAVMLGVMLATGNIWRHLFAGGRNVRAQRRCEERCA